MSGKKKSTLSVTLNGTSWVTVTEFVYYATICEVLVKVPVLANASNVILGLFDPDFQDDGDERWNSGNIPENDTTDVGLDRIVVRKDGERAGSLLKIKADAAANELVRLALYLTDSDFTW